MIREKEPAFPGEGHSVKLSNECRDFISKCLDKNPETRLGSSADFKDLLQHPWLKGISIRQVMEKKITPPFVPKQRTYDDSSNFDKLMVNEDAMLDNEPRKLISIES